MFPQCNDGTIENRFLGYCQPDIFGQIGGKLLMMFFIRAYILQLTTYILQLTTYNCKTIS